jgi:hypothetical protein
MERGDNAMNAELLKTMKMLNAMSVRSVPEALNLIDEMGESERAMISGFAGCVRPSTGRKFKLIESRKNDVSWLAALDASIKRLEEIV